MSSEKGKFVTSANGYKIWAEEAGNTTKPAIVFLHGFGFSTVAFDKQFQDSTLCENIHLIRYDGRGHGRSDKPLEAAAYTSKAMAEDFQAVCEAFNVARPFFAGWSWGGTVISDICEHLSPDYLSGAVCLSVPPCIDDFSKIATEFLGAKIPLLVNPETNAAEYSKAVIEVADSCAANISDLPTETLWMFRGLFLSQSPEVRSLLWQREQNHANLLSAGERLPILVIYGTEDQHIYGKRMEEITKEAFKPEVIEFHALEDCGHMPFYGQPEKTNGIILDWSKRVNT